MIAFRDRTFTFVRPSVRVQLDLRLARVCGNALLCFCVESCPTDGDGATYFLTCVAQREPVERDPFSRFLVAVTWVSAWSVLTALLGLLIPEPVVRSESSLFNPRVSHLSFDVKRIAARFYRRDHHRRLINVKV